MAPSTETQVIQRKIGQVVFQDHNTSEGEESEKIVEKVAEEEEDELVKDESLSTLSIREECEKELPTDRICWLMTLNFLYLHIQSLYGIKLFLEGRWQFSTVIVALIFGYASGLGITIGSHRLWAHKSFKAKWPLRLILVLFQALALQGPVRLWSAWHRAHHKYSETRLDPHNATRGFFYAHIGWLLTYHPKRSYAQCKSIKNDDLDQDAVVMWQDRNYDFLVVFWGLIIPTFIPCYFFGEELITAWSFCACMRVTTCLHFTSLVNSAAHMFGHRPYDSNIFPCENKIVSYLALGEGWHNYHHTFPWDYRTSEFGGLYQFNPSAIIIDFFAKIGWAYDLKTASNQVVAARVKRTGNRILREGEREAEKVDNNNSIIRGIMTA